MVTAMMKRIAIFNHDMQSEVLGGAGGASGQKLSDMDCKVMKLQIFTFQTFTTYAYFT